MSDFIVGIDDLIVGVVAGVSPAIPAFGGVPSPI